MLPGCWGWGWATSRTSTWGLRSDTVAGAWPSRCGCSPPSVPRTVGALRRAGPVAEVLRHLPRKQMDTYKGKCIACIFNIWKNFKHKEIKCTMNIHSHHLNSLINILLYFLYHVFINSSIHQFILIFWCTCVGFKNILFIYHYGNLFFFLL